MYLYNKYMGGVDELYRLRMGMHGFEGIGRAHKWVREKRFLLLAEKLPTFLLTFNLKATHQKSDFSQTSSGGKKRFNELSWKEAMKWVELS